MVVSIAVALLAGCATSGEKGPPNAAKSAIARDVAYCPDFFGPNYEGTTRAQHRAQAETLIGMKMREAERIVRHDDCYIEARSVDGEPQIQTAQEDLHRINVAIVDGRISRFVRFG